MKKQPQPGNKSYFGTDFERLFVATLAFLCAAMLVYLGIAGPLFQGSIQYRTHPDVENQVVAQDAVNMFFLAPLLVIGGWGLLQRKRYARYFLISTPLFLFYFAISYMIGWEWMAPDYTGNSHLWFFHFLFVLVSALLIMLYSLHIFPAKTKARFGKTGLRVYSVVFSVFLALFAAMWCKEIFQVFTTGSTRGYAISPTAFWLVRTLDLGFCVPLGFISIYLLWTRLESTLAIQMLFYGFFVTMSVVVNAMALMMYLRHDPAFDGPGSMVFVILMIIVAAGLVYILKGYGRKKDKG